MRMRNNRKEEEDREKKGGEKCGNHWEEDETSEVECEKEGELREGRKLRLGKGEAAVLHSLRQRTHN